MKTVLLALITMIGGVGTPVIIWLLNKSRLKDNVRDKGIAENSQITAAIAIHSGASQMVDPKTMESAMVGNPPGIEPVEKK